MVERAGMIACTPARRGPGRLASAQASDPAAGARWRAILFDLDGTLADSAECGVLALHAAFAAFALPLPQRAEVIAQMGIPIEQSFPLMAPALADTVLRDAVIARFRADYAALAEHHITLFPGVVAMLDALAATGIPLAIVTSKHGPVAERNCCSLGIRPYFDAVVGPEMVARPKPAPDTALHALALLGIAPSPEVVVVGDASFDMLMGRAAGVRTCAVGWGAHSLAQLALSRPTDAVATVAQLHALLLQAPGGAARGAHATEAMA